MKKFGLLGEHLGHSFSPQLHRLLGDYEYLLYEKSPSDVVSFIKDRPLDGMNVTVPYKKIALDCCDVLSDRAKSIGAVNTIVNKDGKIYGYNTDFFGFAYLLDSNNFDVSGKKCLVLGSGGASLTVQAVLKDKKARQVVVISRSGENNYQNLEKNADADIIINTTPVGMYPETDVSPIDLSLFKGCVGAIDIIYNPKKTKFLLQAEALKIKSCNGYSMLVAQAAEASELFSGIKLPDGKIEEIIKLTEKNL